MQKFELKGTVNKGVVTINGNDFVRLSKLLEDGDCVMTVELLPNPKTIEEYRAQYFAMRDLVAKETGNTKFDIHEKAKDKFLMSMTNTTKELDEEGWRSFIKRFKDWSWEHFNVYL